MNYITLRYVKSANKLLTKDWQFTGKYCLKLSLQMMSMSQHVLRHCQRTRQVPLIIPTELFSVCGILFHVCYVMYPELNEKLP